MTASAPVRYRRTAVAILRQAVVRDLQFRSQFWITLVSNVLEVAVAIVPVLLIFDHTRTVRGWSAGEVIAVTGASQALLGLLATFIAPNQAKMTDYIAKGELDQILIRPAPAQAMTALRWTRPAEMTAALSGMALVIIGCHQAALQPGPGAVAGAAGWFLVGLIATTLIWLNLGYLAFWMTSANQINELLATLLTTGRYPLAFYPTAVRTILLTILPIGVATTLPVEQLNRARQPSDLVIGLGVLIVLTALTRLHWQTGLSRYESASS